MNADDPAPAFVIEQVEPGAADEPALQAIEVACFGSSAVRLSEELRRPWVRVWAARPSNPASAAAPQGSAPAAYLLAWHVADELHVLSVATLPAFRRRGAGRALIEAALGYAATNAIRLVLLEVRRSNQDAISVYRSAGFAATGIRRGYYADTGEDAIEMVVTFDPATGRRVAAGDDPTRHG